MGNVTLRLGGGVTPLMPKISVGGLQQRVEFNNTTVGSLFDPAVTDLSETEGRESGGDNRPHTFV